VREVLDRDPAELQVATVVRELLSGPRQEPGSRITEHAVEHPGPVVVPREHERRERLAIAPFGMLGDRGPRRVGQLVRRRRRACSLEGQRKAAISEDLPRRAHVSNVTIMVPLRFDKARIEALLGLVAAQLDGDWLLIGGAAAAAWFAVGRTTEDVDLVGLAGTSAERLALMNLASSAGLPIEAVNSAADFFVRKIDGWRDELVPLVQGRAPRSIDLDDCIALLDHCATTGELVDRARVLARLASLPPTSDPGRQGRRSSLAESLRTRAP
jgi:hypothetical protein